MIDEYRTFRFASIIPWYVMLPLGILLVLAIVRLYRQERSQVSRPMGVALTALRALLPILLLLMLLEPVFSLHWSEALKGRVIVLLDSSLSMTVTDANRSPEEKVRLAEALRLLPENARNTACEKLATELLELDSGITTIIEEAGLINDDTPASAIRDYRSARQRIVSTAADSARKLDRLMRDQTPPEPVKESLNDIATRLKEHLDKQREADRTAREIERTRTRAGEVAEYDTTLRDLLLETFAELVRAQLLLDTQLAASDDEAVRAAIDAIDAMSRSDVMARLLANGEHGLLAKLEQNFHLECYRLSEHDVVEVSPDSVANEDGSIALTIDGVGTDLAVGVKAAAERAGTGRETAAVLLLTDGQHNAGEDAETASRILAGRNVPLFAVGIGSGEPPRDIAIVELDTSRVIFLGDTVHVGLTIKYDGYEGSSVAVRIEEGETVVAEERVTFPEDRRRTLVELSFVPDEVGTHTYTAIVPVQPMELVEENNRRTFQVDVIEDSIKVLYVEGEPRWEYRFLKNLLLRDEIIDLNRIMLTRDAEEMPRGVGDGYFPQSREELFRYDVIILGDIPAERFLPSELSDLEAFVSEDGGALIVVCGPLFNPVSYLATPVDEMLPVYAEIVQVDDEAKRRMQTTGFRAVLSDAGARSPITRMSFNQLENAQIWDYLPPMHWHAHLARAKPGAEVLLRAPGNADDDCILLATHNYGAGRVMLLGTDDTWRWRWKVGDKYFHTFWGQIMRWATAGKTSGRDDYIRMGTPKRLYQPGEAVEIQARVLGEDMRPLNSADIIAIVDQDGKPAETAALEYVLDSEGRYRGNIEGLEAGTYTIRLLVPQLPQNPSEAAVTIEVEATQDAEFAELYLNRPLLESMARITGGVYLPAHDYHKLAEQIEPSQKRIPQVTEVRLWTWPLFLIIFTAVICTEWVMRKKAGLL